MTAQLTHALKEWAVAVAALTAGETLVLLRKGGIREHGRFRVAHAQVWLYPTYEHQQPQLLKPDYQEHVHPIASGWHPATIDITAFAHITHTLQISDAAAVEALLPFHIWNEQFAAERLHWKPQQPLAVLLLRVYRLQSQQTIAYRPEYGGCKSWIELLEPLSTAGAAPVLTDAAYEQRLEQVQRVLPHLPLQPVSAKEHSASVSIQ